MYSLVGRVRTESIQCGQCRWFRCSSQHMRSGSFTRMSHVIQRRCPQQFRYQLQLKYTQNKRESVNNIDNYFSLIKHAPAGPDFAPGTIFSVRAALQKCNPQTTHRQRLNNAEPPWEFPAPGSIVWLLPGSYASTDPAPRHAPIQNHKFSVHNCCWPASCRAWCPDGGFGPNVNTLGHAVFGTGIPWCGPQIGVAVTRWFYEDLIARALLSHNCFGKVCRIKENICNHLKMVILSITVCKNPNQSFYSLRLKIA